MAALAAAAWMLAWAGPAAAAGPSSLALDALAFARDRAHRLATVGLGVHDLAARLGPAELSVLTSMTLAHQRRSYAQDDQARLAWDNEAGLCLQVTSGPMALEAMRVGEALFVRYNRGQMRRKSGGDMDIDQLANQTSGSVAQALLLLEPLTVDAAEAVTYEHRDAVRFRLAARERPPLAAGAEAPTPQVPASLIALIPSGWRARLDQRSVDGFVVVDRATGVLLQAEIDARAHIVHAQVADTALTYRLRHHLRRIGQQELIAPPASVPEFRRLSHPRDPLAFFRDPVAASPPSAAP